MLIDVGIAKNFWVESINISCYVINKCVIISILEKTLYELLNKRKPKMSYLKAFGSKCFMLNNRKDDLKKFDPRSGEGIFIG